MCAFRQNFGCFLKERETKKEIPYCSSKKELSEWPSPRRLRLSRWFILPIISLIPKRNTLGKVTRHWQVFNVSSLCYSCSVICSYETKTT